MPRRVGEYGDQRMVRVQGGVLVLEWQISQQMIGVVPAALLDKGDGCNSVDAVTASIGIAPASWRAVDVSDPEFVQSVESHLANFGRSCLVGKSLPTG